MPDATLPDSNASIPLPSDMSERIVRAIGLIFSNTFLYGAKHSVTKQAIQGAYASLEEALKVCEEIQFSVMDDELMVCGIVVEQKNPLARKFVTHLAERDISRFSIVHDLDRSQFEQLIELWNSKPDDLSKAGGFSSVITGSGIKSVRTKQVVYREVSEDEVVVSKEDFKEGGGGESSNTILAFLKGDLDVHDQASTQALAECATDADKLGELILKAAEIRKESVDISDGETMAELVVGCLRRAWEGLSQDPSVKTIKGKKNLQKTLLLLEKQLLEKLRAMGGGSEEDFREVADATEAIQDELAIDSLAAEYMKKRSAIEANEKRILRFIKTKGVESVEESALRDKLQAGGLSLEGWHELLVKSGAGSEVGDGLGGGEDAGGGIAAVGRLAVLLSHMQKSVVGEGSGEATGDLFSMGKILKDVDNEVGDLVVRTGKKIADLIENVHADEMDEASSGAEPAKKEPRMPRRKLLELLAEIVQELCQPLSVIKCAIDMLSSKALGDITEGQVNMLELASGSGDKLQTLIDRLLEISGLPETRHPDAAIQSSLYEENSGS